MRGPIVLLYNAPRSQIAHTPLYLTLFS